MRPLLRTLGAVSVLECLSVLALLLNLLTVHDATVTGVLGPVHGALYLAVAAIALLGRGLAASTRVWAVVPLLSGPMTVRNVRREAGDERPTSGARSGGRGLRPRRPRR